MDFGWMLFYMLGFLVLVLFYRWQRTRSEPLAPEAEDDLVRILRVYRRLGFFCGRYSDLSDEELAKRVTGDYYAHWGQALDLSDPFVEYELLALDEHRVWSADMEADVAMGNDVYKFTIEEWSDISRGLFKFEGVTETWVDEEGPVTVTFTDRGGQQQIKPRYMYDWMDIPTLLREMNRLIQSQGKEHRYEAVMLDQVICVTVLTPEEKQRLEVERGIKFASAKEIGDSIGLDA